MNTNEEDFNFNKYWGPESLRPFVEYSRQGAHYCIYCGSLADTREHVPSKAFLRRPLPSDLPVLPACKRCNNGFSSDELYTKTYIECLKEALDGNNYDYLHIAPSDRKEIQEAKTAIKAAHDKKELNYDKRVGRILLKLATGHAVYELSEGYCMHEWNRTPLYTKYIIRSTISKAEWNDLEYAEVINNEILPEIGSRVFRNIHGVQLSLKGVKTEDTQKKLNLVMMDWTDIQDGIYRYIAFFNDDKLIVKMIIMDYLYGEVAFQDPIFE